MSRLNIFFGHFLELRSTLIKSLFIYLIVFLAMMPFANEIYYFFSQPLLDQLTSLNGSIISTKLTSTFIVPFKITAYCALIISLPFIFFKFGILFLPVYIKMKNNLFFGVCFLALSYLLLARYLFIF